jgi:hypothetical protein
MLRCGQCKLLLPRKLTQQRSALSLTNCSSSKGHSSREGQVQLRSRCLPVLQAGTAAALASSSSAAQAVSAARPLSSQQSSQACLPLLPQRACSSRLSSCQTSSHSATWRQQQQLQVKGPLGLLSK